MLKKISKLFAAAVVVAVAGAVAGPSSVLAAEHDHDQVPGFYRIKVGELEVTTLFDGVAVVTPDWLFGAKATIDNVRSAVQEVPRLLDAGDAGFLVNTGKHLILVDTGGGTWFGGGNLGRLADNLRRSGYEPEKVDRVFVTHLHSDHIGGLTSKEGKRLFPNAEVYVAKAESDFWLSPELAAKAPKEVQPFFRDAQAISAPYIKAGKWHTFSGNESIMEGVRLVGLQGHTPGHTGYEFSSQGHRILFWGDTMHSQVVQVSHPEVTVVFDVDQEAARGKRLELLQTLAHEDVIIAGPHMLFPSMGRVRSEGAGYIWAPVVYTDKWADR